MSNQIRITINKRGQFKTIDTGMIYEQEAFDSISYLEPYQLVSIEVTNSSQGSLFGFF